MDAGELCRLLSGAALTWVLLPATLLLLAAVLFLQWRHRVESQAHDRLRAQLFDRDRGTRQLHDTLLQGMQGLILRFQAMSERLPEQDATRNGLDAALLKADQVLNEARDGVQALQQQDTPGDALARALDDVGRQLAGEGTVRFAVQIHGVPRCLVPEVYEEALHILSEAVLNAFRHARAHNVVLTLSYGRLRFRGCVVDDGIGMNLKPPQRRPGGGGMAGMRERAECIEAKLIWRSRPGAGTSLELQLPAHRTYLRP